ncbi:hypothetical protein EI94DRAFT_549036 [Lactarius quietus]|nr:hypothetical protein EI94DRAFT_549036 [Lactarius quietus]
MEVIKDIIAKTMDQVFQIFAFMTKEVKLGRAKRFFKTLSRNLIGSDFIKGALSKLDRLTQEGVRRVIEHVSNTVDRVEGSVGVLNDNLNQFIKDDQEWKAREDKEKKHQKMEESRRRDKEWLSPPDPSTNQNKHIASQARRESSATWIFEENIFMEWNLWGSKSTTSFLWIHGKPGSGKRSFGSLSSMGFTLRSSHRAAN